MDKNTARSWNQLIRNCRGWLYRRLPLWNGKWYRKKLAGYERRWGLEQGGLTKEGFFRILQNHIIATVQTGDFYELVVGDGLVGSLGSWLEQMEGWKVEAWEHRPIPRRNIRQHRPSTLLHAGRLTDWSRQEVAIHPAGITTRGAREASGVCRAIGEGLIRPALVGIWNPSRRPVWYRRMRRRGYRLELVWHRMEFYRVKLP